MYPNEGLVDSFLGVLGSTVEIFFSISVKTKTKFAVTVQ